MNELLRTFTYILCFCFLFLHVSLHAQYPYTSTLADGQLYRLTISEAGVYKLDYAYLKDVIGNEIDNIDPRNISVLYDGGGIMPDVSGQDEFVDVPEAHIQVVGEADGSFDPQDYILFYARGADEWIFSETADLSFSYNINPFSTTAYAYLKLGSSAGKRVAQQADLSGQVSDVYATTSYDNYAYYGEEKLNLLHEYGATESSGQQWFSDIFRITRSRNYTFNFEDRIIDQAVTAQIFFAGRSSSLTQVILEGGGQSSSRNISRSNIDVPVDPYARLVRVSHNFLTADNAVSFTVNYPQSGSSSEGWLDKAEVNVRCALNYRGNQLAFRDAASLQKPYSQYSIANGSEQVIIWDVSNPITPVFQQSRFETGSTQFTSSSDELHDYIAFQPEQNLLRPADAVPLENQNLHGVTNVDMIVIYHPDFTTAVQQYVEHRSAQSGLRIQSVKVQDIYDEFSCGRQDPSAIRNFLRMLYIRGDGLHTVLLYGDGSFDYKNNLGLSPDRTHHFVPTYITKESLNPLFAFPSDIYYTLLEDEEGGTSLRGNMDIAIGRIPVKTAIEANVINNKIIAYDTDPSFLRDWRNRAVFIADDEDSNIHFDDSEKLTNKTVSKRPELNLDKIYFDAYPEQSTSGGDRFPDANQAINRNMFRGALVMNYLGHGGSGGLAQERVLTKEDINNWNNSNHYPLLITATCSFTGFDESNYETAGEQCFLNPNGGAIALLTTVRAVFASQNYALVNNLMNTLYSPVNGEYLRLGETMRLACNAGTNSSYLTNARKFALIGDPAMKLAIPKGKVVASSLNDKPIETANVDTLRALSQNTLSGYVADQDGQMIADFNGKVYLTLFDKAKQVSTLGQATGSFIDNFELQDNILFKGAASVVNGRYSIDFILPKDIDYSFGEGRISLYAENGSFDAAGFSEDVVIGGINPLAAADDQAPIVEVFMDNDNFASGGVTSEDPVLFVKLRDDIGINISTAGIGHELTAVLNDDQTTPYLLRDFYEAEVDDYRKGTVRYPLFNLEDGRYTVRVKAWDVSNNSGEGFTDFIVQSDEQVALERVINYPNPFTTRTCFEFEHNHAGHTLDIIVRIYTVGGTLVKTLRNTVFSEGSRINCSHGLVWNGLDDYGDSLGRGVYVYKVSVRVTDQASNQKKAESEFEKLVILK